MARTLAISMLKGTGACIAAIALTASATAGDAAKGADVFKKTCASCHTIDKGAGNGPLGPNLFGVSGRAAATVPNFKYSPAIKNSGIVWTDDKLTAWAQNPQKVIPGAKMVLIHAPTADQANDVVAYLATKK
ncbi:c-type cytochrome [Rhizomicrobium electricum]|uniref:Cytochrome c family protein n=1 Tax=Rhizomicrobium electricum TaxID=480070 RepID=A0ABP3Q3B4_9PROT|nr:c-type cytochrome [Rhizomicrobium electricum]NIJ49403.1 cytochrome c [Rhizomicrobium electricum]